MHTRAARRDASEKRLLGFQRGFASCRVLRRRRGDGDGCANGSMAAAEWLRCAGGGDWTPRTLNFSRLTPLDFSYFRGQQQQQPATRDEDEETLRHQTRDFQGIPGGIPGDVRVGREYRFFGLFCDSNMGFFSADVGAVRSFPSCSAAARSLRRSSVGTRWGNRSPCTSASPWG